MKHYIDAGRVSDSGERRWTIKAAIDEAVPVPVLTTALYERFTSRGEADYQDKLLSAMRSASAGNWRSPHDSESLRDALVFFGAEILRIIRTTSTPWRPRHDSLRFR